jgi:hypothetical protein
MKALFSRRVPFYLIPMDQAQDSDGFDAYPVEVPQFALDMAVQLRVMASEMDAVFMDMPAPEECTQEEADAFVTMLRELGS